MENKKEKQKSKVKTNRLDILFLQKRKNNQIKTMISRINLLY